VSSTKSQPCKYNYNLKVRDYLYFREPADLASLIAPFKQYGSTAVGSVRRKVDRVEEIPHTLCRHGHDARPARLRSDQKARVYKLQGIYGCSTHMRFMLFPTLYVLFHK